MPYREKKKKIRIDVERFEHVDEKDLMFRIADHLILARPNAAWKLLESFFTVSRIDRMLLGSC